MRHARDAALKTLLCVGVLLTTRPFPTRLWLVPEGIGCALVGATAGALLARRARPAFALAGALLGLLAAKACNETSWHAPLAALSGAAVFLVSSRGRVAPVAGWVVLVSAPVAAQGLEALAWFARVTYELDLAAAAFSQAIAGAGAPRFSLAYLGAAWLVSALAVALLGASGMRTAIWRAALVLAAWAVAWAGAQWIVTGRAAGDSTPLVAVPALLAAASLLAACVLCIRGDADASGRRPLTHAARGALAALLVAIVVKAGVEFDVPTKPVTPARVTVLAQGLQDWDVPRHGVYGPWAGGMFGLLQRYHRGFGGALRFLPPAELEPTALDGQDVLLVINLDQRLSADRLQTIDRFVHDGGTCLVLADHTDVGGLMDPSNLLTGRYGLRVRFDSAKDLSPWTRAIVSSAWIPVGAPSRQGYFPYGIGASLDLDGAAVPLVKARHAFSDRGAPYNLPGSFLGNYAVDAGERVGDVVIVGAARHGAGRVILVGDTTPFQNSMLEQAYLGSVRRILAADVRCDLGVVPTLFSVAGWLLLALWVLRRPAALLACVGAGLLCCALAPTLVIDALPPPAANDDAPVALFLRERPRDTSPGRRRWRSDWQLSSAAKRAGFHVLSVQAFEAEHGAKADVVVVSLPLGRVGRQSELAEFIRAGGEVIFVGGPRHASAVQELLGIVGVRIEPQAHGPLPLVAVAGRAMETPRFASAFELTFREPDRATPLFVDSERTCAARVEFGRGHLTVLADEAFFYADNVEGQDGWNLGNIAFLDRVWNLLRPEVP